jgi:uncharacterized RDD family membrane protein YckC
MGYPPMGYAMPQFAGFWIRFFAYIIDGIVLFALVLLCIITIIGIVALPFVAIGYMPFCWWKWGATPGQRVLGLRVVRDVDGGPISGGTAAVRFIGWLISSWALDIGFIWAAFEPRKRGWHDMMAGTVVIHTN